MGARACKWKPVKKKDLADCWLTLLTFFLLKGRYIKAAVSVSEWV